MSLSGLDESAALIVIDLQKGTVGLPTAHPVREVVEKTARLLNVFRERRLPVVLVTVTGRPAGRTETTTWSTDDPPSDWADLLEELDTAEDDYVLTKRTRSAFHATELDRHLRDRGVRQVFLTGVVTSGGVESTARAAYDYGYNVVLVTDAMTDTDSVAHEHSITSVFPRLGETTTTADVIQILDAQPDS